MAAEPATIDTPAAKRDVSVSAGGMTISDATATEPGTIDTSSAGRDANPAGSCLTMSGSRPTTQSRVCSPDIVKPRPPLNTRTLFVKLYEHSAIILLANQSGGFAVCDEPRSSLDGKRLFSPARNAIIAVCRRHGDFKAKDRLGLRRVYDDEYYGSVPDEETATLAL
ncbi:hypothetical protein CCM_09358 [Cordyceps militaris CM01]|uniref:Uncharacterized protein n=1 Tax=Cordyceps militaris (strain CM01) TaxID=983644 RepID=G3JUK0_CORMM|nr:uncharacterized protein CCM_09358 [Cordyceps militaris CM01]EGX87736.1 hypothetical protein CCM_09358 [Cordyceps militaris CM01]